MPNCKKCSLPILRGVPHICIPKVCKMQARIEDLENIVANYQAAADGTTHWCAECKMKDDRIAELERKKEQLLEIDHQRVQYVRKLEKAAVVWHKYPDEKPIDGRHLFWDSDGDAPHVLPHNDIVVRDNPGVFSTQTHWASLPAPPQEKRMMKLLRLSMGAETQIKKET